MKAITILATIAIICGAAGGQDSPEAARDEARQALIARLNGIGLGDYLLEKAGKPPIGVWDVGVVLVGLGSAEAKIAEGAVRAVRVLADRPLFADLHPAVAVDIVEGLLGRIGGEQEETAISALVAIDRNTPQWMDPFREKAVGLAEARIGEPNPEARRRAAILLGALGPRLGEDERVRGVRRLLEVLEGPLAEASAGERAHMAEGFMLRALALMGVSDAALAERAARQILLRLRTMTRDPGHLPATIYGGLGRHGTEAGAEVREKILERLLADLADEELMYTVTSGRRTPLRHPCSDAVVTLVPALSDEQVARAIAVFEEARDRATTARWDAEDIESLYGKTLQRLRERTERGR